MRPMPCRYRPSGGAPRPPRRPHRGAATRDRAAAPRRHRPGDARREHLRPRPDRVVGDRVGDAPAGARGAVSTERPVEGYHPAAYVPPPHLAEVIITPAGRPTHIPMAPPVEAPAPVTVTIDRHEVTIPAGSTILQARRAEG